MENDTINQEHNNYLFSVEGSEEYLKASGSNVFFALDRLRNNNDINSRSKILSAYQIVSETDRVDITAVLLTL